MNCSLWFGRSSFHTNTADGLSSIIKRLCKDFAYINITSLNKLSEDGFNIQEYFNDWICFAFILRDLERFKLNKLSKINHLIDLLKFN